VSILPQRTLLDEFELEQEKRRKILKRGCQVAGDLDQLSKNGTTYETLIAVHRRIHNLSEPLWRPENSCYEASRPDGQMFDIYQFKATSKTQEATFCLPPKCGTTSWQRALSTHILEHYRTRVNVSDPYKKMAENEPELHYTQFWPPERVRWPYPLMKLFEKWGVSYPTALRRDKKGDLMPIFGNFKKSPINVANTRDPFDRLHSAWTDKFRLNSSFLRDE